MEIFYKRKHNGTELEGRLEAEESQSVVFLYEIWDEAGYYYTAHSQLPAKELSIGKIIKTPYGWLPITRIVR